MVTYENARAHDTRSHCCGSKIEIKLISANTNASQIVWACIKCGVFYVVGIYGGKS